MKQSTSIAFFIGAVAVVSLVAVVIDRQQEILPQTQQTQAAPNTAPFHAQLNLPFVPERTTEPIIEDPKPAQSTAQQSSDDVVSQNPAPDVADQPDTNLLPTSYKQGLATLFWVGEGSSAENGFIHNSSSAWDAQWEKHFGGVDDPEDRCGYHPCEFTPRENPFYIALPYNDTLRGKPKESQAEIPWYTNGAQGTILKNVWIEVQLNNNTCYGQWEDVGPYETNDFKYVFGKHEEAKNTQGLGAGIDLSPALWSCLDSAPNKTVQWRFVSDTEVPSGPWKEIITR